MVAAIVGQKQGWFGVISMVSGAIALMMVVFHLWGGPFEPQKSLERTIAETAVNISKEVVNVIKKKPAVVSTRSWNTDALVQIAAATLGVLALLLAAVGFVRREDHRPLIVGLGLGGSAIAFQFVAWLALLAAGLVLVWIVVSNLGAILSSFAGP